MFRHQVKIPGNSADFIAALYIAAVVVITTGNLSGCPGQTCQGPGQKIGKYIGKKGAGYKKSDKYLPVRMLLLKPCFINGRNVVCYIQQKFRLSNRKGTGKLEITGGIRYSKDSARQVGVVSAAAQIHKIRGGRTLGIQGI